MNGSVLVFDVETTGTDKRRDQVIELCVQFGLDASSKRRVWRIRPDAPISPGAQAVHGISEADVADCPKFAEVARDIYEVFAAADVWVGYNIAFDIDMLQAEFKRQQLPALPLANKTIVDAFRLWQRCEPRSLMDAHRRFVGDDFEAAHSAAADVAATGRVLQGMLKQFALPEDWQKIATVCEPERASWVGPSHHIRWQENGTAALSFGKHAGIPLSVLARSPDSGYLRWMLSQDFPEHVHDICRRALEAQAEEFERWLQERFASTESLADDARAA
jgi:DNA polymerase-3 subunit epsilon